MIVGTIAGSAGSSMYIFVHCGSRSWLLWIHKQKLKELLVLWHLGRRPAIIRPNPWYRDSSSGISVCIHFWSSSVGFSLEMKLKARVHLFWEINKLEIRERKLGNSIFHFLKGHKIITRSIVHPVSDTSQFFMSSWKRPLMSFFSKTGETEVKN